MLGHDEALHAQFKQDLCAWWQPNFEGFVVHNGALEPSVITG